MKPWTAFWWILAVYGALGVFMLANFLLARRMRRGRR